MTQLERTDIINDTADAGADSESAESLRDTLPAVHIQVVQYH